MSLQERLGIEPKEKSPTNGMGLLDRLKQTGKYAESYTPLKPEEIAPKTAVSRPPRWFYGIFEALGIDAEEADGIIERHLLAPVTKFLPTYQSQEAAIKRAGLDFEEAMKFYKMLQWDVPEGDKVSLIFSEVLGVEGVTRDNLMETYHQVRAAYDGLNNRQSHDLASQPTVPYARSHPGQGDS